MSLWFAERRIRILLGSVEKANRNLSEINIYFEDDFIVRAVAFSEEDKAGKT